MVPDRKAVSTGKGGGLGNSYFIGQGVNPIAKISSELERLGQAALCHQSAPTQRLVGGNAMPASHPAHRHARFGGLLDHPNLLGRRPAPTALNRREDLNTTIDLALS